MSSQNSFATASRLVDVVLFAYEPAKKMVPDSSSALKAMLPICNRPMIWYCLQPLVQAGFTNFFICVSKNYEGISDYLCREFSQDIQFHFVVVKKKTSSSGSGMMSDESVDGDVTMCEAVRCFLEYKAQLTNRRAEASTHSSSMTSVADLLELGRGSEMQPSLSAINSYLHFLAEPRDALLLNCDTVLCNIDLENFVKNFYLSLSSVIMILTKPIDACNSQQTKLEKQLKKRAASQKGGGGGTQAAGSSGSKTGISKIGSSEPREFQYQYSCVIYEEEEDYYKGLNQSSCSVPCTGINGLGFSQRCSRSPSPLGNPAGGVTGGSRQEGLLSSSFSPLRSSFPSFPTLKPFTSAKSPSSGGVTTIGMANAIVSPVTGIAPSPSSSPVIGPPSLPSIAPSFHRLHLVSSAGMELDLNITHQYAAKRPNFRVERGVVNPQVYLVRNWVLRYMEECCDKSGEDADLYEDPIPFLTRSQHTLVNKKQKLFLSPDQRIKYNIPTHWFFHEEQDCKCPISTLCACSPQLLPHKADPLRVSAVIYEESSHSLRRIYRIHSCHNYLSANEEIVATRAASLRVHQLAASSSAESMRWSPSIEQETASTVAGDTSMRGGQEKERNKISFCFTEKGAQQLNFQEKLQLTPFFDSLSPLESSKSGKNSGNKVGLPRRVWTLRQQALSLLLPDIAITLENSVGKKEWHIKDSFLPSFTPLYADVTRCVIGPNVLISSGACLTDSVIMAEVEIGEGVEIIHSLIGRGAVIEDNVKLVNCIVQSAYVVKKSAKDESLYEV